MSMCFLIQGKLGYYYMTSYIVLIVIDKSGILARFFPRNLAVKLI
jgi:hypothetical protein